MNEIEDRLDNHETRLALVEREITLLTRDFTTMMSELKLLQAALAEVKINQTTLAREMIDHVKIVESNVSRTITQELSSHECREFDNYKTVLAWVISLLVAGLGAMIYLFFEAVAKHL